MSPQHMVRHVRAVDPAVPYWDLVPVDSLLLVRDEAEAPYHSVTSER